MNGLIRFSFPLSARMQGFLQVRDALDYLQRGEASGQPYLWLQACADLRLSLFGEQGRRPGLADVVGLLAGMQENLDTLADEHPRYGEQIMRSCATLERHEKNLRGGIEEVMNILSSDALILAWHNCQKKHDWLGHQEHFPQAVQALWSEKRRRETLQEALHPLAEAVESLHGMLHDYVGWEQRLATAGADHIRMDKDKECGLLVIGLSHDRVQAGLVPGISGNRMAVRLRFQCWPVGEVARQAEEDVRYSLMLVPVA